MRTLLLTTIISLSLAGATFAANTDAAKTTVSKPAAAGPAKSGKPMATTSAKTMSTKKSTGGGVKAADRTPISKACSAQADTKGLHGKYRSTFRDACMKKG